MRNLSLFLAGIFYLSQSLAAPAWVQDTGGAFVTSLGFLSDVGKNNLLVVDNRCNANDTITFTDTLGNSYTNAISSFSADTNQKTTLAYAISNSNGANTITESGCTSGNNNMSIIEFSGVLTAGPLETRDWKTQASGATIVTPSIGTSNSSGDLIVCGIEMLGTTDWNYGSQVNQLSRNNPLMAWVALSSATTSINCGASGTSEQATAVIASFQPSTSKRIVIITTDD